MKKIILKTKEKAMQKKITAVLLLALLLMLTACGKRGQDTLEEVQEPETAKTEETKPEAEERENEDDGTETIEVQISGSATPKLVPGGGNRYTLLDEYVVSVGQNWSINGEEPERTDMTFYLPTDESGEADLMSAFACTRRSGITAVVTVLPTGYDELQAMGYEPGRSLNADTGFLRQDAPKYIDLQQSEVYRTESGACRISTYGRNDEKSGGCYAVYQFDYTMKAGDYSSLNLAVMIRQDLVEDETGEVLTELEDAYGIEIGWDRKEAEKRAEELSAYAEENGLGRVSSDEMKEFSIGYLTFELPGNWKEDSSLKDSYDKRFAVEGNAFRTGAYIEFQRMEDGGIDVSQFLEDKELTEYFFSQFVDAEILSIEVEDRGKTCLGPTVLIKMQIGDGDEQADYWLYIASDDDNVYLVEVMLADGVDIDVFDYAEHIMESGKLTGK